MRALAGRRGGSQPSCGAVKTVSQLSQDSRWPSSLSMFLLANTGPNVRSNPEPPASASLLPLASTCPPRTALSALGHGVRLKKPAFNEGGLGGQISFGGCCLMDPTVHG